MQELKIIRAQLTNERRRRGNQRLDEFGPYQALVKEVIHFVSRNNHFSAYTSNPLICLLNIRIPGSGHERRQTTLLRTRIPSVESEIGLAFLELRRASTIPYLSEG